MSLYLNLIENASQSKMLSDQEALNIFIYLDLTKAQYMYLRNLTNEWDPKNAQGAQESRNKDYQKIRLHHARKCSRSATNEDVFHTLLYTSDPYISSYRKTYEYNKSVKALDGDTLDLLKLNGLDLIMDPEVHQV